MILPQVTFYDVRLDQRLAVWRDREPLAPVRPGEMVHLLLLGQHLHLSTSELSEE